MFDNSKESFSRGFKKDLQLRYEKQHNPNLPSVFVSSPPPIGEQRPKPKQIEISKSFSDDDDSVQLSDFSNTPGNVFTPASAASCSTTMFRFDTNQIRSYSEGDMTAIRPDTRRHLSDSSVTSQQLSPPSTSFPPFYERKCPNCQLTCSDYDAFAKHLATHLPTETYRTDVGKVHLCRQCQRGFSRSDMLTRHMRLHTGIKPYECRMCGQVFSRSDHLSTHLRTHTGEKPYQCQYCNYAACRRDMITRHLRIHSRKGQMGNRSRRTSSGSSDIRKSSTSSYENDLHNNDKLESPSWPINLKTFSSFQNRSSTSSIDSTNTDEASHSNRK